MARSGWAADRRLPRGIRATKTSNAYAPTLPHPPSVTLVLDTRALYFCAKGGVESGRFQGPRLATPMSDLGSAAGQRLRGGMWTGGFGFFKGRCQSGGGFAARRTLSRSSAGVRFRMRSPHHQGDGATAPENRAWCRKTWPADCRCKPQARVHP